MARAVKPAMQKGRLCTHTSSPRCTAWSTRAPGPRVYAKSTHGRLRLRAKQANAGRHSQGFASRRSLYGGRVLRHTHWSAHPRAAAKRSCRPAPLTAPLTIIGRTVANSWVRKWPRIKPGALTPLYLLAGRISLDVISYWK